MGIPDAAKRLANVYGVGKSFEALAPLVHVVMSLPATSTAAERAQSISGRVCDPLRSRMLPSTVEALTVVQHYLKNKHGMHCADFCVGLIKFITEHEK